ncbi:MAG TPA: MoaD/ThiS family protein [Candidatus Tectomicrobia bacterium]|nr:MoaD/ThiS family protein [Candidatus Tectomicrobia bacterium]
MPSEVEADAALAQTPGHIQIDTVAWVTRFVGGNGSDRISFDLAIEPGDTVRIVLRRLSERFPQLQYALWDPESGELGEHIEVVVNGAILGVRYGLDSALKSGDRILLFGQYMGG